ncbi:hypothetical protein ACHAPV_010151, partial [Trichoderma viride]
MDYSLDCILSDVDVIDYEPCFSPSVVFEGLDVPADGGDEFQFLVKNVGVTDDADVDLKWASSFDQ